jgi:hypothetical protein
LNNPDVSPLLRADRWSAVLPQPEEQPVSMRLFGLAMLLGFGVLGILLLWLRDHRTAGPILIGVGAAFLIWSLIAPESLRPVYSRWMRLGRALGTLVSTLLLTIVYFLVVVPVGQVMRLSGTDPIDRRMDRSGGSAWRPLPPSASADDYTHMS